MDYVLIAWLMEENTAPLFAHLWAGRVPSAALARYLACMLMTNHATTRLKFEVPLILAVKSRSGAKGRRVSRKARVRDYFLAEHVRQRSAAGRGREAAEEAVHDSIPGIGLETIRKDSGGKRGKK